MPSSVDGTMPVRTSLTLRSEPILLFSARPYPGLKALNEAPSLCSDTSSPFVDVTSHRRLPVIAFSPTGFFDAPIEYS